MKYQKRNKSRIRENENNTLLDNDLGKQKEKKTKKKKKFQEHIKGEEATSQMEGEVEELKNKLQTLPMNTLRTLNGKQGDKELDKRFH